MATKQFISITFRVQTQNEKSETKNSKLKLIFFLKNATSRTNEKLLFVKIESPNLYIFCANHDFDK